MRRELVRTLMDPLLLGADLADYETNADAYRALQKQAGKTRKLKRASQGRREVRPSKARLQLAFNSIAGDERFEWVCEHRPKKSKAVDEWRAAWKLVEEGCKSRALNVPIIPKKK